MRPSHTLFVEIVVLWEPALMDRMKFAHLFEKFMVAVDVLATKFGASPEATRRGL